MRKHPADVEAEMLSSAGLVPGKAQRRRGMLRVHAYMAHAVIHLQRQPTAAEKRTLRELRLQRIPPRDAVARLSGTGT